MQKKIIALALAGMSSVAVAQTNVTISGLLDVGVNLTKIEGLSQSTNAGYNNTATSFLGFRANEALGGGMNAGVYMETDARGINANAANTLNDFQRYLYVNGGWGELSFGQRTNYSTDTGITAQPFGTALGGGYSGTSGRLRGAGFSAVGGATVVGNAQTRDVRAEGSVRYDSPNFNGLTVGVSWKPKNALAGESAPSNGHLNLGLNYANGPLKVSYAFAKYTNDVAATAGTAATVTLTCAAGETLIGGACFVTATGAAGTLTATPTAAVAGAAAFTQNVKHNLLGANYMFGPVTLYGGYSTSKGNTASAVENVNSAAWNIALKWAATNTIDVMGNYMKDNDKTAVDANRKLLGLGVDYKMSKRTAAYARYENYDPSDKAANDKTSIISLGMRHAF